MKEIEKKEEIPLTVSAQNLPEESENKKINGTDHKINSLQAELFKKILKYSIAVFVCYLALYGLRFLQLNLSGSRHTAASLLPYGLLMDHEEQVLYNTSFLDDIMVSVRYVDLNGDLKKERIVNMEPFGFDSVHIYRMGKNGTYTECAGFYTHYAAPFYCPPLTIWGYPVIYLNDKCFRWNIETKRFEPEKKDEI